MPKRKYSEDEDSDTIVKKIKRMEKKLKKRKKRLRRSRRIFSSSSESPPSLSSAAPCTIPVPSIHEDDVDDPLLLYDGLPDGTEDLDPMAIITDTCVTAPIEASMVTSLTPTVPSVLPPPPTGTTINNLADDEVTLDEDILKFLGDVPSKVKKFRPKIQSDIASRWEHVATSGVTKEVRKEFQEKYLTPENCSLVDPPALNLEVKAALSESLQKKDIAIQNKQKQISTAVACIGQTLKRALSHETKDTEIIKLLIDAGRIICDVQHTESMLRRGFISSCIKKEVKDHLNDTPIDTYLFGDKLADTLKSAKSIHKSGSEIRLATSASRPLAKTKNVTRPLNPRGPAASCKPPPVGRRFEEAASALPPPPRRRAPPPPLPTHPPPRSQQRPRAPRR